MADSTTLYRLFDPGNVLLYVGVASNPARRFEQHAAEKPWWPKVARITLSHYADRPSALLAESTAISSEGPTHNRARAHRAGTRINYPVPIDLHRAARSAAALADMTLKDFVTEALQRNVERRKLEREAKEAGT